MEHCAGGELHAATGGRRLTRPSSALSTRSGPVHVTATTAGGIASAAFVGRDATTQGAWRGSSAWTMGHVAEMTAPAADERLRDPTPNWDVGGLPFGCGGRCRRAPGNGSHRGKRGTATPWGSTRASSTSGTRVAVSNRLGTTVAAWSAWRSTMRARTRCWTVAASGFGGGQYLT